MWYVSGLSCRKSGSCHSHIDEVVYYVPTGITFSFLIFILSCASMLWIEWISYFFDFVLSLVLFDGLIITLLRRFVNTFLIFILIFLFIICFMFLYFIICLYFWLFSVNLFVLSVKMIASQRISYTSTEFSLFFSPKNPRPEDFVWLTFLLTGDLSIDVWKSWNSVSVSYLLSQSLLWK